MTQRRSRRAGVEDRWHKADGTRSAAYGRGQRWRARWVDDRGVEVTRAFPTRVAAQRHVDGISAALVRGDYIRPEDAQLTVEQWCEQWLDAYKVHRPSTVRQARTHVKRIVAAFGDQRLSDVRPTMVRSWIASMQGEGLAASTIYALHSRLAHVMADAVHDGVLQRSPCSRRTSPPMGKAKVYVATTEQVWALHDEMPEYLRPAVLLGAFAGLRLGEVCGLRVADVDFMRGAVTPRFQADGRPLKTDGSEATVPIPRDLALLLSESVRTWGTDHVVTNGFGGPARDFQIQRAVRAARGMVPGLPAAFTFHDTRHHYASLLIAGGADIKMVQARMRHESAKVTLDTYGHLMSSGDDATRDLVGGAMRSRVGSPADPLRTGRDAR
ncbi:tyrosine-type recombinase/integrase [Dietzia cinnamea]|uniref:tyrosine-type recombinase/integrase n=1 Tax=Dietzia cinnamea TaxID=321318 RepID=UPI0007736C60|nr:site-specific integrase [Dietzia cinnamea]